MNLTFPPYNNTCKGEKAGWLFIWFSSDKEIPIFFLRNTVYLISKIISAQKAPESHIASSSRLYNNSKNIHQNKILNSQEIRILIYDLHKCKMLYPCCSKYREKFSFKILQLNKYFHFFPFGALWAFSFLMHNFTYYWKTPQLAI